MAHSYWRLYILARDDPSSARVVIDEIEFRSTVGGSDQANGGTPSASSVLSAGDQLRPFDNTSGTRWTTSNGILPQWIAYQFTSAIDVQEVAVRAYINSANATPAAFFLQYSDDGATWTNAAYWSGSHSWAVSEWRTFSLANSEMVSSGTTYSHTINNGGAESGSTAGWTNELGGLGVQSASPAPRTGSYYFNGGTSAETIASSTAIDFVADGVSAAIIDNNEGVLKIDYYQSSVANNDPGAVGVRFLDAGSATISESYNDLSATQSSVWTNRVDWHVIPANTRYAKILIRATRTSGTPNDAYFDDITATTIQIAVSNVVNLPVASITLATYAPTVTATDHSIVNLPVAGVTLTTFPPTISNANDSVVQLPVASMSMATFAPTVTATEHNTVNLPVAGVTLTTFTPTITVQVPNPSVVQLPVAGMVITGLTPGGGTFLTEYQYMVGDTYDLAVSYLPFQMEHQENYGLAAYQFIALPVGDTYNLLAYTEQQAEWQDTYDLLAYSLAAYQYSFGDRFALAAWQSAQATIGEIYDLGAYEPKQITLQDTYALRAYQTIQIGIADHYGLLAFQTFRVELVEHYDLNAYTEIIQWLTEHYALEANAIFSGWIMNRDTKAIAQYEGFKFNSLFGDFGAMADGIYELTGSTNNGTAINAFIQMARTDFGSSQLKRLTDAYVSASSDGEIVLSITAQGATYDYPMLPGNSINTVKANLGRGAKDRYWEAKLSNVDGSDFTLESLDLLEQELSRKV